MMGNTRDKEEQELQEMHEAYEKKWIDTLILEKFKWHLRNILPKAVIDTITIDIGKPNPMLDGVVEGWAIDFAGKFLGRKVHEETITVDDKTIIKQTIHICPQLDVAIPKHTMRTQVRFLKGEPDD